MYSSYINNDFYLQEQEEREVQNDPYLDSEAFYTMMKRAKKAYEKELRYRNTIREQKQKQINDTKKRMENLHEFERLERLRYLKEKTIADKKLRQKAEQVALQEEMERNERRLMVEEVRIFQ